MELGAACVRPKMIKSCFKISKTSRANKVKPLQKAEKINPLQEFLNNNNKSDSTLEEARNKHDSEVMCFWSLSFSTKFRKTAHNIKHTLYHRQAQHRDCPSQKSYCLC